MAPRGHYQGYVEDSEEEDILTFDTSALAANTTAAAGPSIPPKPPFQLQTEGTSMSSIQTPDFTGIPQAGISSFVHPPNPLNDTTVSSIQTPDFTANRSIISDISSFGTAPRPAASMIQTAQSISKPADSSISTSTSTSDAPRPKPRPRPVYKKDVGGGGTASVPTSSSSASTSTHPPTSLISAPPPRPLVGAMAPPSLAPSTSSITSKSTSGKGRISDSGIDMAADIDLMYSQDIAERAKLRSRARTQSGGKGKEAAGPSMYADDVIELSSDDELSILPQPKPKPKPKPRPRKPAAGPSSEKEVGSESGMKEKGKKKDPTAPPPKRTKTTHIVDPGFESDVNTIPMLTSDFPIPAHVRGPHSSQLPPSDPPPSSATSSSAHTHPPTSQASRDAGAQRDISPLSSPPPPLPRKRKRPTIPTMSGLESDDELSMDADVNPSNAMEKSKKTARKDLPAPPVPPVPSLSIVPETQPPVKPKPVPRKKRKDPDDDGDGEWGGDVPTKPSKSRKKARAADDDDFGGGGGGEDEDDEDWGASNAKGKGKAKKPAKKSTAKEKKSRSKAKEKEKPPKSKEVIEDSDEERDREAMPPPSLPASTSKHNDGPAAGDSPLLPKDIPPVPEVVIPPRDNGGAQSKKSGAKGKGASKQRAVVLSDEEDIGAADVSTNSITADLDSPVPPAAKNSRRKSSGGNQISDPETKENEVPAPPTPAATTSRLSKPFATPSSTSASTPSGRGTFSTGNRAYTIGAKSTKHTPMSELIRRASAQPGSPFPATARPTYSPLTKASKSTLRRIAPLHPNRRTPPPPPPRPPPPKKSKKMLELEEKWEMELEDSVEGWYAMPEEERAALRRAKRDTEMGFFED